MAIIVDAAQAISTRIGYKNLLTTAGVSVTASDEATGFEKEYAYDLAQYTWWKQSASGTSWLRASFASAKSADYMAVWGHNLHSVGGSVKPQYSTDGGATWNDAAGAVAPVSGKLILIEFSSVSAANWRCLVTTSSGQSVIAGIQIGEITQMERGLRPGFAPPTVAPDLEVKAGRSEKGINIGTSVRYYGVSGDISLTNLTPEWVRSDLEPIIDHLNSGYPAVFSWDSVNYSGEAVLIWATKQIPPVTYSSPLYMDAIIPYEGIE